MTKFYGATWCSDCVRAKSLLDKIGHKYEFINIDNNPEAAEEVSRINKGLMTMPTIVFDSGEVLIEPSNEELVNKLI